jgi:selenocysteine lyase/cysteine desulfurase
MRYTMGRIRSFENPKSSNVFRDVERKRKTKSIEIEKASDTARDKVRSVAGLSNDREVILCATLGP